MSARGRRTVSPPLLVFVGSNLGYFDLEKEMQILNVFIALCQVIVVEMDLLLFLLTTLR